MGRVRAISVERPDLGMGDVTGLITTAAATTTTTTTPTPIPIPIPIFISITIPIAITIANYYGQFSKFHVCNCGLDPGNLKFETVRTHKQHICF